MTFFLGDFPGSRESREIWSFFVNISQFDIRGHFFSSLTQISCPGSFFLWRDPNLVSGVIFFVARSKSPKAG